MIIFKYPIISENWKWEGWGWWWGWLWSTHHQSANSSSSSSISLDSDDDGDDVGCDDVGDDNDGDDLLSTKVWPPPSPLGRCLFRCGFNHHRSQLPPLMLIIQMKILTRGMIAIILMHHVDYCYYICPLTCMTCFTCITWITCITYLLTCLQYF